MEIDVTKIMEEIDREIKEKGYTDDLPSFESVPVPYADNDEPFNINVMNESIAGMGATADVNFYSIPLTGNPVKRFFKKVSRKLIKFLLVPFELQLTEYHQKNLEFARQTRGYVNENQVDQIRMLELQREIRELKARVKELEGKVE